MLQLPKPEHIWLVNCTPRPVQIEATYRSMFGYKTKDSRDAEERPIRLRDDPVATAWSHWMEMRLGKTAVVINEYEMMRRHYDVGRMIVFSPSKFRGTWGLELEKLLPNLKDVPIHIHDKNKAKTFKFLERHSGVVVLNYEAIRQPDMRDALSVCARGAMVVADESISIKGNNSDTTKAALAIAKEALYVRAMTGKPVVQGPQDLWAQLRFVRELNGVNFYQYRNRFCKMGGYMGKQIIGYNEDRRRELEVLRSNSAFIARKTEWMKTPGVEYSEEELVVDGDQKKAYMTMQQDMLLMVGDVQCTAQMVITKLNKLQQISSGFIFDDERDVQWLIKPESNPKLRWLKDKLENEVDSKVIIVCVFKPSLDLLEKELEKFGVTTIRGGRDDTEEQKAAFNSDRSKRIMILQVKAGKYGHTLMGSHDDPCTTMIFYETSYSLDDRAQIEERPQGEGQQAVISVIDLIVTPADLKPIRALQRKEDVAAALMGYDRSTGILPSNSD